MTEQHMFRVSQIKLDSNGELPSRFMLIQSGDWPNSVKGDFSISADDLKQIKENFDKGVGFPTDDASTGLAIDFKHEYDDQAAGWIKGLELSVDQSTGEAKLFASPVEWTDAGAAAVKSGRFKCVSPSGYFGRKSGRMSAWPNPTNLKEKIANVLDGAGLTNIPFLRGMSPVRADSAVDELEYDKMIFVSDSQQKKEKSMTIDAIRVKDKDQLSAEEQKFLEERRSELSADELKKFGLEVDNKVTLTADEEKVLADIREGKVQVVAKDKVVVEPEQLSALQDTAKQYRTEKAETVVHAHIKRGAIKQDSADFWTKQLLDATTENRKALEEQLAALPENKELASELGTGEDVNTGSTAREQLNVLATEKIKAAAKENKELSYPEALKLAIRENPELSKQDVIEQGAK